MNFPALNIPPARLKISQRVNDFFVWDEFRNKNVKLTPEEWVRQHFLHYLFSEKGYPKGRIAVEKGLNINGLSRRYDAVVFSDELSPLILIEFKAPDVKLTQAVLEQIAQYNFVLRVNFLVLSNGLQTITAFVDEKNRAIRYLEDLPTYEALK